MNNPSHSCSIVDSENAGKELGCKGCPNQLICSSKNSDSKKKDQEVKLNIFHNLRKIKNILLIMSGKGGVGKSTLACHIAEAFALDEDINVGLLDIDISGPSIPHMLGINEEKVFVSNSGWSPIFVKENLCVLSCAFMLESQDEAVIWRGPKKDALIKHFLQDVDWNELDYLIIDTPPGTSDEHLSSISLLKSLSNLSAIIITTPQMASLIDVKKQVDFCNKIGLNILGIVENMANFNCINCHEELNIFKPSKQTVNSFCDEKNLKLLTSLPIDPFVTKNSDLGISIFKENSTSNYSNKILDLILKLKQLQFDRKE